MKNRLSGRELEVLSLAVKGYTDDMIAQELGIECGTVNSYWVRIRGKMGNFSRTELVARFVQKNADVALSENTERFLSEADARDKINKELLGMANAEIEILRKQLRSDASNT